MKLSEYSDAPDRYKRTKGATMHTVVLVDGWDVARIRVRDGVALSMCVLEDAMKTKSYARHDYRITGGNGFVTAYSGGRAVMSAYVTTRRHRPDHYKSAPAYEMNR